MKKRHILYILLLTFAFCLTLGCADKATETESQGPEIQGEPELIWSQKHEENLHSIAASKETVAVGEYKVTYIHHLYDGSLVDVLAHEHTVDDVKFSKDESILGAGQGYHGVQLSYIKDDTKPKSVGDKNHDSRLAFSADGAYLATGDRKGIVWIWKLSDLTQTAALENEDITQKTVTQRYLLAIDYHPSGKYLVATHADNNIYVWDLTNNKIIHTLAYEADVSANNTFRFSPDGNTMAVAAKEGTEQVIRLYSLEGGDVIKDLSVPERVHNLNFSPDGSLLAVASREATTIFDVESGELLYTLKQTITPPDNTPVALTFTPDAGHLAVARWDGTVELWRLPGAEAIAAPKVDISLPPPLPGDVLFDTGSAEIKQAAHADLDAFAQELYTNFKEAGIKFIGHTDSQGNESDNLKLSKDRAMAIMNWFKNWATEKGADGWELLYDGKGESELKVPDTDIEGKFLKDAGALNRRVEIELILD